MNIQFLESKVVPLSTGNRPLFMMSNKDSIIDQYFPCLEEPNSNLQRVRPRSSDMPSNKNNKAEGFKALHKCPSQAKGLVDLLRRPEGPPSSCGNRSPKSSMEVPPPGDYHKMKSEKRNTNRSSASSIPFPPLPDSITRRSSRSIPIASSSLKRTASELQLIEDEAMADYRDFCMYLRIVNGMNERRSWNSSKFPCYYNNDGEIQNIIRTRHNPVKEGPSSYMREGLERHSVNSPLHPPKVVTSSTKVTAAAPTLAAPSLTNNNNIMTPCYNYSTRKTKRVPSIVIQEPTDYMEDNILVQGMGQDGKCLQPCCSHPNHVDSSGSPHEENDESEAFFVMDDV